MTTAVDVGKVSVTDCQREDAWNEQSRAGYSKQQSSRGVGHEGLDDWSNVNVGIISIDARWELVEYSKSGKFIVALSEERPKDTFCTMRT